MINERIYELGAAPNKIREIFAYGLERKAALGADRVFDLSLGNPSVPTPAAVDAELARLAAQGEGTQHGYTPSPGLPQVRAAIAENLNRRFGQRYGADNLYLTSGASSSIAITFRALLNAAEEAICITPYFPEYRTWIENAGGCVVEVPARPDDFRLDIDAIEAAINSKTAAIIINSPNNPVGSVYTEENLAALAHLLERKSAEFGHAIYLVSDEPYRELVYGGTKTTWIPDLYPATVVCYSWSKSFSLPGERIGYILVPDTMPDWRRVYTAICGGGRALGYICASTMFQHAIANCVDEPVVLAPYERNRQLLMDCLETIGYTFIEPQGAFYLWIQALEPDANAFCERAKEHELLLVPSDTFGVSSWVRAGYCVPEQSILGSRAAFEALWRDYH